MDDAYVKSRLATRISQNPRLPASDPVSTGQREWFCQTRACRQLAVSAGGRRPHAVWLGRW